MNARNSHPTTNPATEIGHPELGQIALGSVADIAVLRVDHGHFGYADLAGGKVDGTERIVPEMTIRAGRVLFDRNRARTDSGCQLSPDGGD